jgi:HK97 family phage major capsid protein
MSDSDFALRMVRDAIKAKLDERDAIRRRHDAAEAEVEAIISTSVTERRDITDAETALIAERRAEAEAVAEELRKVDADLDAQKQRETLLVGHMQAREASKAQTERWAGIASTNGETAVTNVRVGSEPRTYNRDNDRRGQSFFRDVYTAQIFNDPRANERLARHMQEARVTELAGYAGPGPESRDVGTGAFAGLTVPQYLTDMAAPGAKAYRPTIEICNRHDLPADGMTVNISRITTQSATAAQATENSAVQETDMDDTLLAVDVRTYAGQQDVSRQAIERGTGIDTIVIDDLTRDYWTKVDAAVLNGAGTSGTHLGVRATTSIIAVTYTDTTPTVAELYPKLADLISQIQSGVFMGVTHFIMHPRRWWWLASSVGTSFPFLHVSQVSTDQAGNIGGTEYMANNRNILGVPVVVDGNMLTNLGGGTNQDDIVAVTASEMHFWDDGVQFIRAEQTTAGSLTVKFVLYGYSAFSAGRYPGAHGTVAGTGLVTPTF